MFAPTLAKAALAVTLLLTSAQSEPSSAAPRLVVGSDPQADEIRGVVSQFYMKMAALDAPGTHALIDGQPPADLADAEVALLASTDHFVAAATKRFGASDQLKPWSDGGTAYRTSLAQAVKSKLVMIAVDDAEVSGSSLADPPLRLHRTDAGWKVRSITARDVDPAGYLALVRLLSSHLDEVTLRITTGNM